MTMKETKEEKVAEFLPQISVILSVRLLTSATKENSIARSPKDATLFGGILFKINYRFFTGGISVASYGLSLLRIIVELFKAIRAFSRMLKKRKCKIRR